MDKLKKIILILILVIVLIIIVVGIVALVTKGGNVKNILGGASGKYSLVYVQTGNGSASYYGQIIKETSDYITLKDPGYINIQPAQKEGEQPQVSFVLMKDEFFKPISEMKIVKQNVVFVQELANDSPIVDFYKNQVNK